MQAGSSEGVAVFACANAAELLCWCGLNGWSTYRDCAGDRVVRVARLAVRARVRCLLVLSGGKTLSPSFHGRTDSPSSDNGGLMGRALWVFAGSATFAASCSTFNAKSRSLSTATGTTKPQTRVRPHHRPLHCTAPVPFAMAAFRRATRSSADSRDAIVGTCRTRVAQHRYCSV